MIVSVTITNRRDDMIVEALSSALPFVDACLVVSTHGEPYGFTIEREVCGEKLRTASLAPITSARDTATRRTEALALAGDLGATWVLVLDTDERMHWREGQDVRGMLAGAEGMDCFVLKAAEGHYSKDKIIRPGTGTFQADAHEAWVPTAPERRALLHPGPKFSELPKAPEALRARDLGVIEVLKESLAADPDNARYHYYIASSYEATQQLEEAERHYNRCIETTHWGEEAGWSNYRLGVINHRRGRNEDAVACCALALACCPAIAEAAWLAGYIRAQQNRVNDAIAWSSMSIANGAHAGVQAELYRLHMREPGALWEAPYETLRACYAAMGQPDRAATCAQLWHEAYRARLAEDGGVEIPPECQPPLDGVTIAGAALELPPAPLSQECHERAAE